MKTLVVIGVGCIVALMIFLFWVREADARCNEQRVAQIKSELLAAPPTGGSPAEVLEALEDEHGIECNGSDISPEGDLLCDVMTHCGLGSSLDAEIDIHVRKTADGGWSLVP